MKGISPVVATVLLIAIVVTISGIVSIWVYNFTKSSATRIKEETSGEVFCSKADITLSSLNYCNSRLSGIIDNTGTVALQNLTLHIIYQNASQQRIILNNSAGNAVTLNAGSLHLFNLTIGSNYDLVIVVTNCTGKTFSAQRSDIISC